MGSYSTCKDFEIKKHSVKIVNENDDVYYIGATKEDKKKLKEIKNKFFELEKIMRDEYGITFDISFTFSTNEKELDDGDAIDVKHITGIMFYSRKEIENLNIDYEDTAETYTEN